MIKVVHIIDGLGWAGMEQMVASLVCRIDKSKFQVFLLSEIPMKKSVIDQVAFLKSQGVKVIFLQQTQRKKFLAKDYFKLLKHLQPLIIHSHSGVWRDCCLGALLAGVPHQFHTEHGRIFLADNSRTRLTHRYLTFFRNKVIAVSDDVKQFLHDNVGIPKDKLLTIHNGIDVTKFSKGNGSSNKRQELGLKKDDIILIAVGRLNPVKDYDTLIRAISQIKQELANKYIFKLIIVGPETKDHLSGGGTLLRLRNLANDLNVDDRIAFLGKRADIPELLGTADVFVQTSLTEGLSMSIMEAMSCQLPVVATNVGGNKELISDGETGYLVPSRDAQAVAKALKTQILDDTLRLRMGANGRQRILNKFSLEHMTKRYESLYLSAGLKREI